MCSSVPDLHYWCNFKQTWFAGDNVSATKTYTHKHSHNVLECWTVCCSLRGTGLLHCRSRHSYVAHEWRTGTTMSVTFAFRSLSVRTQQREHNVRRCASVSTQTRLASGTSTESLWKMFLFVTSVACTFFVTSLQPETGLQALRMLFLLLVLLLLSALRSAKNLSFFNRSLRNFSHILTTTFCVRPPGVILN